jgi:hypothetical protein
VGPLESSRRMGSPSRIDERPGVPDDDVHGNLDYHGPRSAERTLREKASTQGVTPFDRYGATIASRSSRPTGPVDPGLHKPLREGEEIVRDPWKAYARRSGEASAEFREVSEDPRPKAAKGSLTCSRPRSPGSKLVFTELGSKLDGARGFAGRVDRGGCPPRVGKRGRH